MLVSDVTAPSKRPREGAAGMSPSQEAKRNEPLRLPERDSMPREKGKARTIAFVTYPGLTLLDLVGPITAFYGLTMSLTSKSTQFRTVSVAERVEPIDSDTPMALIPDMAFEKVPDPFALIVPGGGMHALKAMGDERLLDYLRFASYGAEVVASVSTGAFLLAAAGLLEGRRATTHPSYGGLLQNLGVDYVSGYSVEDGKFLTTAGVSGGIDATLELAAKLTSEAAAKRAQYMIEYDPEPPFGGLDWSEANGDGLARMLDEHRADLERALAGRPDLYQKMFG
jgi:transcriptional regulator GlxA family with amidase domain